MVLLFGFSCCIRQDLVELFSPVMMIEWCRLVVSCRDSSSPLLHLFSLSLSLYLYTCIHTYIIVAVVVMLWYGGNNQCVAPSMTYKLLLST
ncbi:unnamed protein product [Brassica oleracea var. botrytis]|uniref:(rape) hypothetical protein n=1 Tax=Brassica napus TaxID=3708 RepID=A0A816QK89_BRANA|nr:unnamed protein product [Brassica napus]